MPHIKMPDLLKKSQNLVEKTKLQTMVATKTLKLDSLFEELGKVVYESDCGCIASNEAAANILVEIKAIELEIASLKDQILALSNKVRCTACGELFSADMSFCGHCGAKKAEEKVPAEDTPDGTDGTEE